jgi:hypothetical protein
MFREKIPVQLIVTHWLVLGCSLHAQILAPDRVIGWSPGVPESVPVRTAEANVMDFGAAGDSLPDDYPAFTAAIASLPPEGGTVRIPAGRYLLRRGLRIDRGILMSGEGFRNTRLYFDLDARIENAVEISRPIEDGWTPVSRGCPRGSLTLETERADRFSGGDFLEITRDNDPGLMYTNAEWNQDWAADAVGQIVRVESTDGNRIRIRIPLYLDYPRNLNPKIRRLDPVLFAGLEKLSMKRLDSGLGDMIVMRHAAFCRVSDMESAFTTGVHVMLYDAFRCEVTNGYFHHAHGYGAGGRGYGADCATHATDNKIENNIFAHLRHAMMAHVGASGNVFGYNYSCSPESDEGFPLADLSLHGHYANYNLFEANTVQRIAVGDYWGPAGPGNVFLRNVVEAGTVSIEDFSHGQSFVGNGIRSESGEGSIGIHASVRNTLLHGNRIGETVQWDPSIPVRDIPMSYYLDGRPAFWGNRDWPARDEGDAEIRDLPAKIRYRDGTLIESSGVPEHRKTGPAMSAYPNPTNGSIRLRFFVPGSGRAVIRLVDLRGRTLHTFWDGFLEQGTREWALELGKDGRTARGVCFMVLTMGRLQQAEKITIL